MRLGDKSPQGENVDDGGGFLHDTETQPQFKALGKTREQVSSWEVKKVAE
jgi:hypothetical protein